MAIVKANIYKASYEDLTELSVSAGTMKGALGALAKNKDDEPVQLRRMAKGISQVEEDGDVTISISVDVGGTVVPLTAQVAVNEPFKFYAIADAHHTFVAWRDAEGEVLGTDPTLTYTPDELEAGQTIELSAQFEENTKTSIALVVDPDGAGTAVASELEGYVGEPVTLEATPEEGYEFTEWRDAEGTVLSTNAKFDYTFQQDDVTVTAVFSAKQSVTIDVTVDTPAGTTAYVAPAITTAYAGDKVKMYAVPTATANFDHWEDADGTSMGSDNPLVYTVPVDNPQDVTFKAVFVEV